MNAVSLFAGIGGFDLALERHGHTVTDQVEIDRHARAVLARHFPDTRPHEDIHDYTGAPTDIVVGGFPCQDYSVAGSRGGLAGDRGALWWQMHRVVAESRPLWVVGENVPGLLSSNDGQDFRTIVASLVELGYGVVWRVLDAQYFGVAQRRRRVFIVGHSGGVPRPEVLALGEGCQGDTPPSRGERTSVATITARGVGGGGGADDNSARAGHLIPMSFDWQAGGGSERTFIHDTPGSTRSLTSSRTLAVAFSAGNSSEARSVAYSEEHTPPLRAGASGTNQVPTIARAASATVRRLTPLECERLQGFPDGWTERQSDTQRYRQLGNAVAVPVVEWVTGRLA